MKIETEHLVVVPHARKSGSKAFFAMAALTSILVAFDLTTRWFGVSYNPLKQWEHDQEFSFTNTVRPNDGCREPAVVELNLTLSQAWRNPDGGYWRPMFVGNSETPFKTINTREGDVVKINLFNEVQLPWMVHWVGLNTFSETWNDGTAGVSTYPIIPRANRTTVFNTTGQWGLKWALDHVSVPSVEGGYGTLWIRPSPARERPYHLISKDSRDLQDMLDTEENPAHVTIYNYQHRQMASLIAQLQGEGYDPYCFQSVLINGKGRVHCKPPGLEKLDGKDLDTYGCIKQPTGAVGYDDCKPSQGEYEIIETGYKRWIMMNFVNTGFEHVWHISLDKHKFWIVANDGGFVTPQQVDVLHVMNGERTTVLVRLDQPADDYAIRFYSYSKVQAIQGYSILRYPHKRSDPIISAGIPQPNQETSAINVDGTVKEGFILEDADKLHPYPPVKPDQKADITLRFTATGAPDPVNPYVTNCSLNGAPWQLFREFVDPIALYPEAKIATEPEPIIRNLPVNSVIDIIVENDLPVDLPMYKHNDPTFKLGSGSGKFSQSSYSTFNLDNPPLGYFHELPANGWLALRWKIVRPGTTMFAAYKVRYFVQGMQVALMEGDDDLEKWPMPPKEVRAMPHADFDLPPRRGIFD